MKELTPSLFNDGEILYGYGTKEKSLENNHFPLFAYDEEHAERWHQWVETNSLREATLYSLHIVNGGPTPIRWLVSPIETVRLIEQVSQTGIQSPPLWKLMAPIHINSTSNNTDASAAVQNAQRLCRFATEYIHYFHPSIDENVRLELEVDDPHWISTLFDLGERLWPHLPEETRERLIHMSEKHRNDSSNTQQLYPSAYLLAHYRAYGRLNNSFAGGFPPRHHSLFILPQSEETFVNMMSQSENALEQIGLTTETFSNSDSIIMISKKLKTPHYYPHQHEPLLQNLYHAGQWPTINQLSHQHGLNGRAKNEIIESLKLIEEDIGGKTHLPELIQIINKTLHY